MVVETQEVVHILRPDGKGFFCRPDSVGPSGLLFQTYEEVVAYHQQPDGRGRYLPEELCRSCADGYLGQLEG